MRVCFDGPPETWCKSCGWDPDGHYCLNKQVIQLRVAQPDAQKSYPYGLAVERAYPLCNGDKFEPREREVAK